jgi:thiol-disulfide isomerase/thioredoxin
MKRTEIFERAKLPSLAKEGWLRPSPKYREASLAGADGVVGSGHRLSGVERTTPAAPSKEGDHFLGAAFLYASPNRARASRPPLPRRGVRAVLCFLLLLCGCRQAMPEQATWNGTLELAEGKIMLPFQMDLDLRSTKPQGYFLIGSEKAPIPEITRQGSSITISFSEYGAEMHGAWDGRQLTGTYVRHRGDKTTTLKFSASPNMPTARLDGVGGNAPLPAGKYQVFFGDDNRHENATVASFWTQGDDIYGTFIAPDGDYGLLVGRPSGGKIQLNRFTGWQAIAMTLEQTGDQWTGNYYFQNDKPRAFMLEPRTTLDVTPPPRLTATVRNPGAGFTFQGVSISGETVRSSDDQFRGKPLIIDIMGTWCHNCIDSSPLLNELQQRYGPDGLQVVGLSFEISDDLELGKKNLKLFKDRLGLKYTLLFCGTTEDANVESRLRTQLQNFFAYPTTLFIGRDGKVRTVHSGFKGPGTGEEFNAQVREFQALAAELVK